VVSGEISSRLEAAGVSARVYGREKQPYSIWRKLQSRSVGFSQLSDIYAFRVIVDSEDDTYRALGVIHRAWPCVRERFKDYVSTPKRNNYRSLHTTVVGPKGMRIEMQIRTEAMDRVAEEGIAAHWRYKGRAYGFDADAAEAGGGRDPLMNLRPLVQVLEHGGDAEELVEHAPGHVADIGGALAEEVVLHLREDVDVALGDRLEAVLDVEAGPADLLGHLVDEGDVLEHQQVRVEDRGLRLVELARDVVAQAGDLGARRDQGGLEPGELGLGVGDLAAHDEGPAGTEQVGGGPGDARRGGGPVQPYFGPMVGALHPRVRRTCQRGEARQD